MENLNAERIKRGLVCCKGSYDCFTCDIYKRGCAGWRDGLAKDALALINSQEQRIGELEKRLRYLLQSKTTAEYDEVDIQTKEYVKDIHSLDANIEHLTKELTRKETEYNELYELCESYCIERDAMRGAANSYKLHCKTLEKENESLKTLLDESFEAQNTVKADTVRKMQERLKAEAMGFPNYIGEVIAARWVDQIAKELVEGADNG